MAFVSLCPGPLAAPGIDAAFPARTGTTTAAAICVLAALSAVPGLSLALFFAVLDGVALGLVACDVVVLDGVGLLLGVALLLDAGVALGAVLLRGAAVVRSAVLVALPLAEGFGLFVVRMLVGVADPAVPVFTGVAALLAGSPLRAPVPVALPESALGVTLGEPDAGSPGLGEGSVPGLGDFEEPERGEVSLGLALLLVAWLPLGVAVGVAVLLGVPLLLVLVLGLAVGLGLVVGLGFFVPVGVGEGEGVGLGFGIRKAWHCGGVRVITAAVRANVAAGVLDPAATAATENPVAAATRTLPATRLTAGRTCAKRMRPLPVLFVCCYGTTIQYGVPTST
jgi:hypothetical protein